MWILIISLYAGTSLGLTESKGILHIPTNSLEQCERERDRVNATWRIDGYRTNARCTWIKHYSTNRGAYNSEQR